MTDVPSTFPDIATCHEIIIMGRRPINDVAMTNAERQRRRRQRLASKRATAPDSAIVPVEPTTCAAREIADMESEIDELKNEVRQLRLKNEALLRSSTYEGLLREAEPLLSGLEAEGKKEAMRVAPATVAYLTHKLRQLLDA